MKRLADVSSEGPSSERLLRVCALKKLAFRASFKVRISFKQHLMFHHGAVFSDIPREEISLDKSC